MIKVKNIKEIRATEEEFCDAKFRCHMSRISPSPALTAVRTAHKALNEKDFNKGLEQYVDRIKIKSNCYEVRRITEDVLATRFDTINNLAEESCILYGFAANNLFYHLTYLTGKCQTFFKDVGDILEDQLHNEFDAVSPDTPLIEPDEINEVVDKFDTLYPGFAALVAKNKTIFAIIDAYKRTEDGAFITAILNPDFAPMFRDYIFLFRLQKEHKKKAVLVHELCHMLLEKVATDEEKHAHLEKVMSLFTNLKEAEANGNKEEVICQIMTCGVLQNDTFASDGYQDVHAATILGVLGAEHTQAIMTIANDLFAEIVTKETN